MASSLRFMGAGVVPRMVISDCDCARWSRFPRLPCSSLDRYASWAARCSGRFATASFWSAWIEMADAERGCRRRFTREFGERAWIHHAVG